MKLSPLATTFTCGLFTVGLLAGCATTPTSTPSPSVSASREAAWGLKGTNLQLVNNSGKTINVLNKRSDSSLRLGEILNGGTASAEGTSGGGDDVDVQVRFADDTLVDIRASNPIDGIPFVGLAGYCKRISFSVGGQRDYVIGEVHGITVKRLPDDDWKQFQVTFTANVAEGSKNFCTQNPEWVLAD